MNTEYLINSFNQYLFSDISIILKDANEHIQMNCHRNILATNDYFKNLLTNSLKEKNTNEITLEVYNVNICKDIIMSFYGIPINFSNHRYILEYIKCCDYWLVPYENILTDDLKVPEKDFDLLLEIGEIMNYSDRILKIIARNIPEEYDLSGIPIGLKNRMIKLEQISFIASASGDKTIKIWDLDSGTVIKSFNAHTDWVYCICYIQEKNQIASGNSDNTIKIWDLESGTEINTLIGHSGSVLSVCYISEKNKIASGKDKVQPGRGSDGLLTGSTDNTIKIWDLDSCAVLKTLKGHTGSVRCVCHMPDKNQIASGSTDDTIKIWDLDSGVEIKTLIGHTGWVNSICYIPDNNQIASGGYDQTIKIWDLDTGSVIKTLIRRTYFVDDLYNAYTGGREKSVIMHAYSVDSVCYIQEKNLIASGNSDKTIKIWDFETDTIVKTLTGHTDIVISVQYIPEKNQIVSGSRDKTIKIWDLETGTVVKTLNGHTSEICSLCHIQMDSAIAKRLKINK